CFNYRFYPMIRQLNSEVASHNGKVNLVYGGYVQDWCSSESDYSWRMNPGWNGPSRAIADIGSHWCDTMQYILDKKIVKVFADLKTVYPVRKKPKQSSSTFGKTNVDSVEN